MILKHTKDNAERFSITTNGSKCLLLKQLKEYVYEKKYDSDFCDILPNIIAEILNITIGIIQTSSEPYLQLINESNSTCEFFYIHKSGNHYDAMVRSNHINNDETVQRCTKQVLNISREGPSLPNIEFHNTLPRCSKETYNNDSKHKNMTYIKEINEKVRNKNGLRIAHINCRSLYPKLDEISWILSETQLDILCLSETWLDSTYLDADISIAGYTLFRKDRKQKRGGGVAIYIRDSLTFLDRSQKITGYDIEMVLVEIVSNNYDSNLLVATLYRPPDAKSDYFDTIIDCLDSCLSDDKDFIILGDINYNYKIDETLAKNPINLIENLFGLSQLITKPTRVTNKSSSLIDVILSTCPEKHVFTGVQPIALSDHSLIYTIVNMSKKIRPHKEIRYRNYKDFNEIIFLSDCEIKFANINGILQEHEKSKCNDSQIEYCWDLWKTAFIKLADAHAPFTIRRLKNRNNPWITPEITKLIYQREYYHKKALNSDDENRSNFFWKSYKQMRNNVTKIIRKSKQEFYREISNTHKRNPKTLWKHIRQTLPKNTNDNVNDITPDTFNNFFSTIGENVSASINTTEPNLSFPNSVHDFTFNPITKEFLETFLNKLPDQSKNDILGFDTKLLKVTSHIISRSLCSLFNISLVNGYLPKDWKIARVTPAFKGKGDQNDENNYRPLSVIAHLAKLIEKCVHKQLIEFLYKHSFISKDQFAYLKNHSTSHCLHRLVDDVLENINYKEKTALCFIDIRKCFDTINHRILLQKLHKYGIRNNELKWFTSYLKDRSQVVCKNNTLSDLRNINIGVPQGTILGPILFLLYVNDLSNAVISSNINVFADDVVIYSSSNCMTELQVNLQCTLDAVYEWYSSNKLTLSIEKCNIMVINSNPSQQINDFKLRLGDKDLSKVNSTKYLGVYVDDKLKWTDHLKAMASKVNMNNSRLRRLNKVLPLDIRIKIHNCVNIPIFDYAATVWGDFSIKIHEFVTKLEHRCARAITGKYDIIHTRGADIMKQLNLSNFKERLKYQKSLLMYKAINGDAPDFLKNYITFKSDISQRNLRSSDNLELYIPKPNKHLFKKSLSYSGPQVWNTLPLNVRQSKSLTEFKRLYKTLI
jgi:hypothetical protein